MSGVLVGILSLAARERRLVSGGDRRLLAVEDELAAAIRATGARVVTGGGPFPEEDQVATGEALARLHLHTLVDAGTSAVVLNVTGGPSAGLVLHAVRYLEREQRVPPRLVVYASTGASPDAVPSVALIAAALRRNAVPFTLVAGSLAEPAARDVLVDALRFCGERALASPRVVDALRLLPKQKILAIGGPAPDSPVDLADPAALYRTFGVTLEFLEASALAPRVLEITGLTRAPGAVHTVIDPRLAAARDALGLADRDRSETGLLALALATSFALEDLARERDATIVALGHGFEVGGSEPDAETAVGCWSSPTTPGGRLKEPLLVAPGGDVLGALGLWLLHAAAGGPVRWSCIDRADGDSVVLRTPRAAWEESRRAVAEQRTLLSVSSIDGTFILDAAEVLATDRDALESAFAPIHGVPDFLASWPKARLSIADGRHGASVAELAHRLGVRSRVRSAGGRIYD